MLKLFMVGVLVCLATVAVAQQAPAGAKQEPAYVIPFATPILDENGEPMRDIIREQSEMANGVKDAKVPPLTLGTAVVHALLFNFPDENDPRSGKTISFEEKWKRGQLAMSIMGGEARGLRAEQIAQIKNLISKLYSPIVVFRAAPLLDPAEAAK